MEFVKGPASSREELLTRLVAQYEVSLLRTCYMYLHDKGLAEDATQETFLKAYKALATFRGDSSEKTWLMRIAINTCRDMQRTAWFRYVDRRVEVDLLPTPARDFDFTDADALTQAILRLPTRHKEVILLHFYQDMTIREIAVVLDLSASAVQKRIKAACGKLKKMLGKEDFYEPGENA